MAFASADEVAVRLGRDLTAPEEAMVEQSAELVTELIAEVAGYDVAWADALNPVPAYYKVLCIEKVLAVGTNPSGLASMSEQLGAYQHSKTFRRSDEGADLLLSEAEERQIRRIANNAVSGSVRTKSLVHDAYVREVE